MSYKNFNLIKWYCDTALSPEVTIQELLDPPVVDRKWNRDSYIISPFWTREIYDKVDQVKSVSTRRIPFFGEGPGLGFTRVLGGIRFPALPVRAPRARKGCISLYRAFSYILYVR